MKRTGRWAVCLMIALLFWIACPAGNAEDQIQTYFLNLGKADAILLRLNGQDYLVDTGSKESYDQMEDALRMLRALSGAQHHVHTGVCIAFPGGEERFTVTTKVKFYPIEEAQLEAYAATGEPYDKAGAYAIQGGAAAFCEGLEGCYYNVMGFPVSRVARALAKIVEKI